jgi:hypothetical protein
MLGLPVLGTSALIASDKVVSFVPREAARRHSEMTVERR